MNIKIKLKKKILKLLLEDSEIREVIKNIGSSDNSPNQDELKKEIEMLKGMINKLKETLSIKESDNQKAIENIDKFKQEIDKLKSKLNIVQKDKKRYIDIYQEEIDIYNIYQSLSSKTKSSIENIFKDNTIRGFLVCGVQEKNINSLWEYIRVEIIEDKNSDIDKLIEIFNFLFANYLKAYPIYQLQDIKIGDEFKTEIHINTSSNPSGYIKEIQLNGWINNKTKDIVKKSLVKV